MNVFVYRSAYICEDCGLAKGLSPDDAELIPSDDIPRECDICDKFLENPLNTCGVEDVLDAIAQALERKEEPSEHVKAWATYYGTRDNRVTLEALGKLGVEINPRWTSVADVFDPLPKLTKPRLFTGLNKPTGNEPWQDNIDAIRVRVEKDPNQAIASFEGLLTRPPERTRETLRESLKRLDLTIMGAKAEAHTKKRRVALGSLGWLVEKELGGSLD